MFLAPTPCLTAVTNSLGLSPRVRCSCTTPLRGTASKRVSTHVHYARHTLREYALPRYLCDITYTLVRRVNALYARILRTNYARCVASNKTQKSTCTDWVIKAILPMPLHRTFHKMPSVPSNSSQHASMGM